MIEINKIYNENCIKTMERMPDNFIDLTVTSPPYDNLRSYNGYEFDFESIAKELYRVTKIGGVVVWIVGDATIKGSETGTSFKQALYFKQIGFNLHDTMIYSKKNFVPLTHNRYEQQFEYMFVLTKKSLKTFNPIKINCKYFGSFSNRKNTLKSREYTSEIVRVRDEITVTKQSRIKGNIWEYLIGGTHSDNANIHSGIFPEQLANDHIISWSNEGDLVYDCFMGSGTTAKMCLVNNRNYIGSEISKEYCDLANKRIEIYNAQGKLF